MRLKFKRATTILVAVILLLSLNNFYGFSAEMITENDLLGEWENRSGRYDPFVFEFSESNNVEMYQNDSFGVFGEATYSGTYIVENENLLVARINMSDDSGNFVEEFGFELTGEELKIIFQANSRSGYSRYYYSGLTFTKISRIDDAVELESDDESYVQEDDTDFAISTKSVEAISVIFVAAGMESQAYVRSEVYAQRYGTASAVRIVDSAEAFIKEWNKIFNIYSVIDAIEIMSHGGAEGFIGYATGYLYFTADNSNNRLFARDDTNIAMNTGDYSLSGINVRVTAKEFNINSCNSANPDVYNILYGFMQITNVRTYSGFDGGAIWDSKGKDTVRGGGDYAWWSFGNHWYSV